MIKKTLTKFKKDNLTVNLQAVECPKCHDQALYTPDGKSINCSHCEGSWTLQAFRQVTEKRSK